MPFLRIKRFKIITFVIILFGGFVIFMYTDMALDLYYVYWQPLEDTSCHYLRSDDDLPSSESQTFFPSEYSIFFHETSCSAGLNTRQACAVEAAARQHPEWEVHVFFTAPMSKSKMKEGILAELLKFGNVKFLRLHIIDYVKGTPIEDMVRDGALNRTRWRISHTSDVVRYLTLYKWGGIHLDLDTVCARPFDALVKNWAARENQYSVGSSAMSFSRNKLGRWVANAAMWELKYNFRGDKWSHNGPGVITRVLKRLCSTTDVNDMNADTCHGFEVYGTRLFYPVPWSNAEEYFLESGELIYGNPYIYHVWNKITKNMIVPSTSVYGIVAAKYCPLIYNMYKDNF